ncbi:MAG: arylsulfatase [Verrucomicrobia bacterium]|nr:arylsulfatase [Verrucomicrobiota bacterium]
MKTSQPIRRLARVTAALAAGTALASALGAARPNVILIMPDDQGYGDLHCHGNAMIRTPAMDRLYAQSVRLTNFHVDPTCSQTRAALMTGRYSTRTGVWHTIMGRSLLAHDEVTMADLFAAAGYKTAMVGKWHLGDNYPMRAEDRGFQEVLRHGGGGIGQTPDYWGNDYFDDVYLHNSKPEQFHGYCTDVFFSHALRFIRANRDRPFFLYLAPNAAHGPYRVPERYRDYYLAKGVPNPMASFYGMIENIDENLGVLMDKLDEWGLAQNTILIFLTDNGTSAGVAGGKAAAHAKWRGFNAGMRGKKGSAYDGGHRVPCFIRWLAGGIGGGKDVRPITAHFDLLPTLAELCGLRVPERVQLDGRSLAPLLRNPQAAWPKRTLFAHVQRQEIPPKWIRSAVMTDRWRLVNGKELYDMSRDPGQQEDVAAEHPDTVARLRREYEAWWRSLTPAFSRYSRIVIGDPHENPSRITCHDWHSNQVPWDQSLVRRAPWANGYWMIQVAKAGKYRFVLRQQPPQARFPIQGDRARIRVNDRQAEAAIPPGATEAALTLDLPSGPAKMQTWFFDSKSGKSRGAFFVEAKRLP